MNYRHYTASCCLLIVAGVCLATSAVAQITIDRSVVESFIGRTEMAVSYEATTIAGVDVLISASGPNQAWNVTSFTLVATDTTTLTFLDSGAGLPGAETPEFVGSNFAQIESFGAEVGAAVDSVAYVFGMLTDDAWTVLGLAARFENRDEMTIDTLVAVFQPPTREFVFPLTFGTTWRDSTTIKLDSLLSASMITETTVDGWGTLTTEDGTRNVLRLFEMDVETVAPVFSDTSYTIIFQAADGSVAEIELDENMTPLGLVFERLETVITSVSSTTPAVPLSLLPGYPNPVVTHASIPFVLAASGSVRLHVFDLLGRKVATLVDGTLPAGRYEAEWAPTDVSSGLYLVRLESDHGVRTRTLTLRR